MVKDYTSIAETAARLTNKYGRSMVAVKFDAEVTDVNRPWMGASEPRGDGAVETSFVGVVVSISEGIKLGITVKDSELAKQSEQMIITSLGANSGIDLSEYNEVSDQDTRWKITMVDKLQPAGMILLYFIGVKR